MRTSIPRALVAVLSGALLLAACGSQSADSPRSGRLTVGGSDGPDVSGDPADTEKDGVRITGTSGGPYEVEVTNHEAEPFTYTITFDVMSASGGAMASGKQTVPAVAAGRTVTQAVQLGDIDRGRLRIAKVRRVPSAEAPAATGRCPASGVRVTADDGDAAMGLRVVGLHLVNCGTRPYAVNGYPLLGPLDEERKPVSGVRVLHGSGGIATVTGFDTPPRPVTLKPGEAASARLLWRNTTEAGLPPVNAPYVRVRAKAGAQPVMVTPELDLGTTGKLGVSPWQQDSTR
ncbi:DUF4232 domain-containing protein [Streptomyces sp. NPDC092296]|uniref:DUF4232 domain-containing protein n=1 Tax=Streptomyces sp. NPDC092296 TaxID=3366012 RepID=UPI00380CA263